MKTNFTRQSAKAEYVTFTVPSSDKEGTTAFIMKLNTRTLYNLAADPVVAYGPEKSWDEFYSAMLKRGAVLNDYKTPQGEIVAAERSYNAEGKLTALKHMKDGVYHNPGKGKPALIWYASPDYERVASIAYYQEGIPANPKKDEPAIQHFDEKGLVIGAFDCLPSMRDPISQDAIRFLNIRKGLIALDLPKSLQSYVI